MSRDRRRPLRLCRRAGMLGLRSLASREDGVRWMAVVVAVWCFVIASFAVPIWWNWRFIALYLRPPVAPMIDDASLPRACILLPLRGTDPHLRQGLHQLLTQDYPNYALHIVVDSPDDPA